MPDNTILKLALVFMFLTSIIIYVLVLNHQHNLNTNISSKQQSYVKANNNRFEIVAIGELEDVDLPDSIKGNILRSNDIIYFLNNMDNNTIIIIGKVPLDREIIASIRMMLLNNHILVLTDTSTYINLMESLHDIIPGYYYTNTSGAHIITLMDVNPLTHNGRGVIIYGANSRINYEYLYRAIRDIQTIKIMQSRYNYPWIIVARWSSDNSFYPYGRLDIEYRLGRIVNEEIFDEDWYFVKTTITAVPGTTLSLSNYRIDWIESKFILQYNNSRMYHLAGYDPTSIIGPIHYINVSLSGIDVSGPIIWSYRGDNILSIIDKSDFGVDTAWWIHDIYQPGSIRWIAASQTVEIAPGFLFRVNPLLDGNQLWIVKTKWIEPDSRGLPGDSSIIAIAFNVIFNLYP